MAGHRLRQGLDVLTVRASLSGKAMQVITTRTLEALTRDPSQVFLGFGFEWLPVHSQRLYELAKVNYKDYAASPAVLRLLGYAVSPQPDSEIGLPFTVSGRELVATSTASRCLMSARWVSSTALTAATSWRWATAMTL